MIQLSQKVKIILAIISGVVVVGAGAAIIMPDSVKVKMTYKSQLEDLQDYYEENYSDNKHDGFIYSNDKEGNPILFAIHVHKDGEVADVRVLKKIGIKVKTLYRTSVAESSGNTDGVFLVYTDGLFMVGSYDENVDGGAKDMSLEVHQVSGGKCNKVATYDKGNSKGLCFKYKGDELSIPYDFNEQEHRVFGYCTPKRKDSMNENVSRYTCIDPSDYDMDEAEVEENANKLNKLLFGEKYSKSKQVSGFLEAYVVGCPFECPFYTSEIGNVSDGLRESGTSDRLKFTAELMKQYDNFYKKMGDNYYSDTYIEEFLKWHPENYNYVSDCYYFSKDDNEKRKSYFEDIINNDIKSLSKINDSKRDSKIIKGIMLENAEDSIHESIVNGFTSEDADKLLKKIIKEELKTGSIKEEAESYEAFIKKCRKARDELEAADNSDVVSNMYKAIKKMERDDNGYRIVKTSNYFWVVNRFEAIKLDMNGKRVLKVDLQLRPYYSIYYSKTNELLKITDTNTENATGILFVDEVGKVTDFSVYIKEESGLYVSDVDWSKEDGCYYLNGQVMHEADYYFEGEKIPVDEYKAKYSEMNGKGEWQEEESGKYVYLDEMEEYLGKEFSAKSWRPIFEKMLAN